MWWLLIGSCVIGSLAALILWLLPRCQEFSTAVEGRTVLVVTAHPDDECMFFTPTLLSFTKRQRSKVILLCLSIGDYYNQGHIRKKELLRSASILGIQSTNVKLIHDQALPDNPSVDWDTRLVGKYIQETISQYGVQVIITFDDLGVSGHPNHIAVSRAVRTLKKKGQLLCSGTRQPIQVLLLETTSLLLKYTSFLCLLLAPLRARYYTVSTLKGYSKGRQAMQEHKSQYVWFRKAYILFSRYMYINTFKPA